MKNGYMWLYTKTDQVVLQGEENIGRYSFGSGALAKTFCKTCGVCFTNEAAKLTEEEKAALSEQGKKRLRMMTETYRPLNLRVLNDYNIKDIKETEKLTFGVGFEPKYVDP
jgi:hypothetical protein